MIELLQVTYVGVNRSASIATCPDRGQTPYDLRRVPNCESLTLYRIPRSRFWRACFRIVGEGRYRRGPTWTEDFREATAAAKRPWLNRYSVREKMIPCGKRTEHHIKQLQAEREKKVARGSRNPGFASVDKHRFAAVQKFFKDDAVVAIDGQRILDFEDHLYDQNPKISKAILRHYFVAVRKINPRTGFAVDEYKKLRDHLEKSSYLFFREVESRAWRNW